MGNIQNIMGGMIFDILEMNIVVSVGIVLLCLFAGKLRRRYGAGWMKLAWLLLAVRLLIPYNFSTSFTGVQLLNYVGFEQEREAAESSWPGQGDSAAPEGIQTGQGDGVAPEGVQTGQGDSAASGGIQTGQGDGTTADGSAQQEGSMLTDTGDGVENAAGIQTDHAGALPGEGQTGQTGNAATGQPGLFYTALLIKIWLAGVAASVLYLLIGYLIFYGRCKRSLCPITDSRLLKEICRQQRSHIGQVRIMACKSTAVSSPRNTGLIRLRLILPADAEQWHTRQLELVMAHELCHYRKKDLWLKMLPAAACCVNWFNPMVHIMKRQSAYDMELACDGIVLAGRNEEEREIYARVMLRFAGGSRSASVFSTGFSGNQKKMKARIDYMLDTGTKKKGIVSIVLAAAFILVMGVAVSCGYKAGEGGTAAENNNTEDGSGMQNGEDGLYDEDRQSDGESGSQDDGPGGEMAESGADRNGFDYNHVYNDVIRYWQGNLYLTKEDGIYCLQGGQGEEQLLYESAYDDYRSRGMEIDGNHLYFCGQAPAEKGDTVTVYRMDLETHEVVDALAGFDLGYEDVLITNISVYEGNLYVALGAASERLGFSLNENGQAVSQLDQQAEDFLYREHNEYMRTEIERLNAEFASEEYWELCEVQNQRYQAVIDVASCRKLLGGRQVVSRYKDESLCSIYLENEDGTYDYLCDAMSSPPLVTESGVYMSSPPLVTESGVYYDDISGDIWYADFATKQTAVFYARKDREPVELSLMTYDADYVYLLQNRNIGDDRENNEVTETYIVRAPRDGGEAQKVYRFEGQVDTYGADGWYRHCGVYDGRMYFDNRESFSLDPEVNAMQAVNSGEPCEDAVAIADTIRTFADAYFGNDADTLRGLLTEDFEGRVEMYAYPEQAGQIWESYIGGRGMPDENVAVGVTCYVFYKFGGHAETGEALAYLSLQMTKTEEGFRVRWYGIEL